MKTIVGQGLFYVMSALTIFGGILFVSSRNIVHAVLYFLVSLLGIAGLFLLLKAPFVALTQVLVYGGAITVLILFVVMLTITDIPEMIVIKTNRLVAMLSSLLLFLVITFIVATANFQIDRETLLDDTTLTKSFGSVMFRDFLLPFEIAAILLLAALVAAIYLAIGGRVVKDEKAGG